MKLPLFEYRAPSTLDEAIALLAAGGGEAKALAGGLSLIPTMAFRLARPKVLVDLRRVTGLDEISVDERGVTLGAKVRWRDIECDQRLRQAHPLLTAAISHIAHYQIRNRGTIGGSLAHADPAAELPGIAVACDASVVLVGSRGQRIVTASDFFVGPLSTVLADDELVVELRLPSWPAKRRWAFEEFALRRGDFAIAGLALFYDTDDRGRVQDSHIGVIGACQRPHRVTKVESVLNGRAVNEATIRAAMVALQESLNPPSDLHASAEYRSALAAALLERALLRAAT